MTSPPYGETIMKLNLLKMIAGVFALTVTLAACGDEGAITGLDTDTELSALTDEEQKLACENSGAYMEENAGEATKKFGCMMAASMAASFSGDDFVSTCEESFDACMTAPAEEEEEEGCELKDLSACEGTVADVEACFDSMISQLNKLAEELKCEEPQEDDAGSDPANPFVTAECTKLFTDCPAFGPEQEPAGE